MNLYINNQADLENAILQLRNMNIPEYGIHVSIKDGQRTLKQNSSLHQFYGDLANDLNNSGLDMRVVLKPSVPIEWDKTSVKKKLWKPIQEALEKGESTTDLTRVGVSEVYQTLAKHMAEKFGITTPFPQAHRG